MREKEENNPGLFSFLRGLSGILGRWYLEPTSLSLDRRCELRTDLEGHSGSLFFLPPKHLQQSRPHTLRKCRESLPAPGSRPILNSRRRVLDASIRRLPSGATVFSGPTVEAVITGTRRFTWQHVELSVWHIVGLQPLLVTPRHAAGLVAHSCGLFPKAFGGN